MARIPYAPATHADADHPMNLFRMLAHSPPVLQGFSHLGAALLMEGALDPRLREIAVLRVGLRAQASYEVTKHTKVARRVGVTEAELQALQPGAPMDALDDRARAVIALTDALCDDVRADDVTFGRARRHFDERQLVELVVTIGYYGMVCRLLETLQIDLETSVSAAPAVAEAR